MWLQKSAGFLHLVLANIVFPTPVGPMMTLVLLGMVVSNQLNCCAYDPSMVSSSVRVLSTCCADLQASIAYWKQMFFDLADSKKSS